MGEPTTIEVIDAQLDQLDLPVEIAEFTRVWLSLTRRDSDAMMELYSKFHSSEDIVVRRNAISKVAKVVEKSRPPLPTTSIDEIRKRIRRNSKEKRVSSGLQEHRKFVGVTIAKLRVQKNLSQEDLAQIAGLHQSHVSRIENGTLCATYKTISRIASALDVGVSLLDPSFDEPGDEIKRLRRNKGIDLEALARRSGIEIRTLRDIEDCSTMPSSFETHSIANVLNVRPEDIDARFDLGRLD